jgi:beta-glucosidase
VNKNTIVVIHSVGPLVLETILALPNVVAVVWAGIPGQESGNALVDILYGSTSPSGKLPYTIGKQQSDYGTAIANGDDSYSEGLYIDYRHFDNAGIAPRYEFGFGLSYTTFAYSSLVTGSISNSTGSGATAPGGVSSLWDVVATVTATVTNTGTVAGAEVAQLYIGLPSSAPATPPKQLRGFDKLSLAAGAAGTVTFPLRAKDLSYWDSATAAWVLPTGTFNIYVGASSRDIRLTGTIFSAGSGGSGSSSKWTSLGCYTDSVTARTLGYTAAVPGGATVMTVEACQTVCLGLGYTLAGVEYADECCKYLTKFYYQPL